MSGVSKIILFILLATAVMFGACFYWVAFVFPLGAKPMRNYDRSHALGSELSQLSTEDFKVVGVPVPMGPTELPAEQVRRLAEQLAATGRFPGWKPGSQLVDLYGRAYLFSVRRRDASDGTWIPSPGESKRNEFVFEVSTLNEAGERETYR